MRKGNAEKANYFKTTHPRLSDLANGKSSKLRNSATHISEQKEDSSRSFQKLESAGQIAGPK
jgi:hypothetical protein